MTMAVKQTWMGKAATAIEELGVDPLQAIMQIVDYLKVAQVEETKRQTIAAKRDVLVQAIESQKELIERYFEELFRERAMALRELFAVLKDAVHREDTPIVDHALEAILTMLQDDPLQGLDKFGSWYHNPDSASMEL